MLKQLVGQRYRIKGLIGEGGMASVYAALDEKLDRRVAIKVLHPHLARNADIRDRFLLEAKTVSTLDHPNIIKVYDFSGLDSEQLWMVTEILYGVDLADYVKRFNKNRLHPIVAALIVREISRALAEVHKLQIVHRDIKPENIMMLDSGHVKLMDFGIAKVHRANATQTGTFMGSPSYMSPEQIRGSDVDVRADIYSLSVLFYEIVTGALPYLGQTTAEVINKIMVGRYTPPNLLVTDLPYALNEIILRGMQSTKEQRYQDIKQLAQTLEQFLRSFGFDESRLELEKFTQDRATFELRLANLQLNDPKPSRIEPRPETIDPVGDRQVQISILPTQNSMGPSPAQRSSHSTPPLQGEVDRSSQPIQSQPSSPANAQNAAMRADAPPEFLHTRKAEATRFPETKAQAAMRPAPPQDASLLARQTTPPQSLSSQSPVQRRSQPSRRIFIREHRVTDTKRRRSSNASNVLLIGLVVAIALVVVLGGDRLSERLKRDSTKVTQQIENLNRKTAKTNKPDRPDNQLAPANPTPQTPAVAANEELPPVVESQTVTIDSNARTPPHVSERELTTPRVTRPITSTTRTLPSPPVARPNREVAAITRPPSPPSNERMDRPERAERPPPATTPIQNVALDPPVKAPVTDRLPLEPPEKDTSTGVLKIAALPAAEIVLDGKLFGTTNDKDISSEGIALDPGTYVLRLRRKGYRPEEQTVQIRAGEVRQLNVALAKAVDLVEFTIRTNRVPASATIEDLRGGGRRREVTLNRSSFVVNLKAGTYRVTVSHAGSSINRVIELTEGDRSITFNAEFK